MQRDGYIFDCRERGEEIEELEDEADFVTANLGEGVVGIAGELGSVYGDGSGGGLVKSSDEVEERGFAGAGGSDEGDHFTLGDCEVDLVEGGDGALALKELADALEFDHVYYHDAVLWRHGCFH